MNVNDLICVGAEPLAMVDYVAVEQSDPELLAEIGEGLKAGAEQAGIEIPGGELACVPELIRGHPSPFGFDLVGAAFGTVRLDAIVSGEAIEPGDGVIGLPSSGIHSNGLTLARKALLEQGGYSWGDTPDRLARTLGDELLEPTEIYVRSILELLRSGARVHGLAHITGDGLLNVLRLNDEIGYELSELPDPLPVFGLIEQAGGLAAADMYEAFNMGVGFCCVVAPEDTEASLALLRKRYPSARSVGQATEEAGVLRLPSVGLVGRKSGFE
jgi:phosphoribosylformylglycinamidine cyclo-ligase